MTMVFEIVGGPGCHVRGVHGTNQSKTGRVMRIKRAGALAL